MERASVSCRAKQRERERESRGGREEGIRLRDKAAGTGCLAGSRSYCVLPKSLRHSAGGGESFFTQLLSRSHHFLYAESSSGSSLWADFSHHCEKEDLLDSRFALPRYFDFVMALV